MFEDLKAPTGVLDALRYALTTSLPDVTVFLLDRELRVLRAEGDALKVLPWVDQTMFVGRRLGDLYGEIPAERLDRMIENYEAVLAGERREFRLSDAGTTVSQVAAPVRGPADDSDPAVVVVARDITRQVEAEAELMRTRERHRTLSGKVPGTAVGIVGEDPRWVILEGADVLADLGIDKQQTAGRRLDETALPDQVQTLVSRALDGRAGSLEWHSAAGRTYVVHGAPLRPGVVARRAALSISEVTRRHGSDGRMHELRARFERAFEHGPTGMVLLSLEGDRLGSIVRVNQALCTLSGYTESELVGRRLSDLAHPDDVAGIVQTGAALARGELDTVKAERRYINAAGETVLLAVDLSVIPDADGRRRYALAHATDITAQKRNEQEAAEASRLWHAAFTSALDAMIVADGDHSIRAANDAACAMLEVPRGQLVGRSLDEYGDPPERVLEMLDDAVTGEDSRGELSMVTGAGRRLDIEYSLAAGFMAGRNLLRLRDVSDRKREEEARDEARREQERLEAELQQFQRLETVGKLAGGIAHDFNNLLAVIQHSAEFALDVTADGAAADELREIRNAADRAAALTRQLLAFSRQETANAEKVDVNRLIADVDRLLRRTLGEDILFERSLDPTDPLALADPRQVENVLLNLALNARDAMADGGTLTIESSTVTLDEDYTRLRAGVAPGRYVRIAVRDTGTGMTTAVRARAFDPFFTTKPKGRGTGLGLATTYGIVKQAGGHVEIESGLEAGTAVNVYLPLTGGVPAGSPAEEPTVPAAATGERILVVEDESGVRRVIQRILLSHGYDVVCAATCEEALERVEGVDLVLTDVVLPGVSGSALVNRLREARPDLPIVFMSGYKDPADALPPHSAFLAKPFSREALLGKVAQALARQPA